MAYPIPIGQAVLQKVVAKLGGLHDAAAQLGIQPSLIKRMIEGTAPVPDAMLLRAVDIVLDELPSTLSDSRTYRAA